MQTPSYTLTRAKDACNQFTIGKTTLYAWQASGLITPGISLGLRSVAWPQHELDQIAAARIAGKSEEEIRALVCNLVAARADAGKLPA